MTKEQIEQLQLEIDKLQLENNTLQKAVRNLQSENDAIIGTVLKGKSGHDETEDIAIRTTAKAAAQIVIKEISDAIDVQTYLVVEAKKEPDALKVGMATYCRDVLSRLKKKFEE